MSPVREFKRPRESHFSSPFILLDFFVSLLLLSPLITGSFPLVLLFVNQWCTPPPPHSGFKFQTVALSLLYAMSLVQLLLGRNTLSALLVLFSDFSSTLLTIPVAPMVTIALLLSTLYLFVHLYLPILNNLLFPSSGLAKVDT
jgi:hypothetical protein